MAVVPFQFFSPRANSGDHSEKKKKSVIPDSLCLMEGKKASHP